MSHSNKTPVGHGPLGQRLGFPVGIEPARSKLAQLRNDLDKCETLGNAKKTEYQLRAQPLAEALRQPDLGQQAAVSAANEVDTLDVEVRKAMGDATKIREPALKRVQKTSEDLNKSTFGPIQKQAEAAGVRSGDFPVLKSYYDRYAAAKEAVLTANSEEAANLAADAFDNDAKNLAEQARKSPKDISQKLAQLKVRAELAEKFRLYVEQIEKDVSLFEVATGAPTSGQREKLVELREKYAQPDADMAKGVEEANLLGGTIQRVLKQIQSTDPFKDENERVKLLVSRKEQLQSEKQSEKVLGLYKAGFKGLEGYWPLVEQKIALVQKCLADKMPPSGKKYVQSLIDEIGKMLDEVEKYSGDDEKKYVDSVEAIELLTKQKQYLFFNTDLKNYLPNDANVLAAQFNGIQKDTAKMTPAERLAHVEALQKAAEATNLRAAGIKALCDTEAKQKLDEAKKQLELLNNELAKQPSEQRGGKTEFMGAYAQTTKDLETALKLGPEGPDPVRIKALMAKLDAQLTDLMPLQKIDPQAVLNSHKVGLADEEKAEKEKAEVKKRQEELKQLLEETTQAVADAKPGDENELAAIRRAFGEAKASAAKLPPAEALTRFDYLADRMQRLKEGPRGGAVTARGELKKNGEEFVSALAAAAQDVQVLKDAATDDYAGDKQALAKLLELTMKRVEGPKAVILKAVGEYETFKEPHQLPQRLRARETGLAGVRQYQQLMQSDAVMVKLAATSAFGNQGLRKLGASIRDLELNLLRGI